ncbi:hypothetical protein PPERSA_01508 [Pseudocohnilembus persalinus]|uniref:Uncharacterized protein n=1 Tax=Pseudocohnilembus persalinus TaxID=266149 RepID=A0A0V0QHR3_PSEPJ|nr:hypothetical protein PPERSA_01508 [Pseudocohnilembus persalinus]|eukprot:KRX01605.1 hypothetical protein PPERSA_01508 [Pseudocohnilembus persalinus]
MANYQDTEQIEVLQITPQTSINDLDSIVNWIYSQFSEQTFDLVSIIMKKKKSGKSNYDIAQKRNAPQLEQQTSQNNDRFQEQSTHKMQVNETSQNISLASNMSETTSQIQKLFNEAKSLKGNKDYEEAEKKYFDILYICDDEKKYSAQLINANVYIGSSKMHFKKKDEAQRYFNDALKLISKYNVQEKHLTSLFYIYNSLGTISQERVDYENAIKNWQQALDYIDQTEGEENKKQKGHILNSLGMTYNAVGKYNESISCLEQSIEVYKSVYGDEDISIAQRYHNLGETYRNKTEFQKAIDNFDQALRLKKKYFKNDNDKSIANTYQNIGLTYFNMKNQYKDCIYNLEQALQIYEVVYGSEINLNKDIQNMIAGINLQLGDAYKHEKNIPSALLHYEKAYYLKKKSLGNEHKATLYAATVFAQLLYQQKSYQQSQKIFEELLEGQKKTLGQKHIKVAQTMNNLATVLNEQKKFDESLKYADQAIEIFESESGADKNFLERAKKNRQAIVKKMEKEKERSRQG